MRALHDLLPGPVEEHNTLSNSDNSNCHHACLSVTSNKTVTIRQQLSHNSGRIKKATLSQADSKAAVHYDEIDYEEMSKQPERMHQVLRTHPAFAMTLSRADSKVAVHYIDRDNEEMAKQPEKTHEVLRTHPGDAMMHT